jgi:alanyl-tRNA synthetase
MFALSCTTHARHALSWLVVVQVTFQLYDTYGFPFDLTELMAEEHGLSVDVEAYQAAMKSQQVCVGVCVCQSVSANVLACLMICSFV